MRKTRMTLSGRLRGRRPTVGMVLAIVALIAALGGTAVAGSGFLTTKKFKKQAVRGPIVYSVTNTAVPGVNPADSSYVGVSASCPSGTKVIGGGIKIPDPDNNGSAYQNDSYPTTSGWAGHVSNYAGAGSDTTATTIAVCATVKSSTGSPPSS
jgi:hypothetical protein